MQIQRQGSIYFNIVIPSHQKHPYKWKSPVDIVHVSLGKLEVWPYDSPWSTKSYETETDNFN